MNSQPVPARAWPPAFSDTFIDGARALFRDTAHVMVVGPLGSHRGTLASAITGPSIPTAWGRDTQAYGAALKRYFAVNQLLPNLGARPDQPIDEVVEQAESILAHTFGRPAMSLREADLCDQGSVDVLAHLVEQGRISLVSTVGPATAATHRFARSAARIDLSPLDRQTIAHLLTTRFDAAPHPTTVAMLAARSQGAYAVLKELADAGFQTGQIRSIAGSLVTDTAVTVDEVDDAAESASTDWAPRFAADHPSRDLIDVAAIALRLDLAEATTAFGANQVAGAVSLGALRTGNDQLIFASRVEAMLVRRALPVDRRTDLFDRYFAGLAESSALNGTAPRIAEWLMSIGTPLPASLAVQATSEANRQGRYALALRFAACVEADRSPSRLLIERCHALSESGARAELEALLQAIDPHLLDDDDLFPYLRWVSRYLPEHELARIRATLHEGTDPTDARRLAVLSLASLYGTAFQNGSEETRRSLMALAMAGNLSLAGRSMAQSGVAASLRQASLVDQAIEVAATSVAALTEANPATCDIEAALETQILCHMSAGDFDGARDALDVYSSPGVPFGNLGRLGTAMWGLHAFFSGDIGSALAHAQISLARTPETDPHHMRGWIEAMSAQFLTQVGDIDQVYDLLEASRDHAPNPRRQHDLERRLAQACVHDAIGEPEEALVLLQGIVDEASAHQLTLVEVDAAVLCVQIGGPVHLRQLLRAVEHIDESCGTSWIWRRFAHDVRDNDMRALVELAEELGADGKVLFAAEVAQFTLDIARRAADMSPQQRLRLVSLADPMQHRHVTRIR